VNLEHLSHGLDLSTFFAAPMMKMHRQRRRFLQSRKRFCIIPAGRRCLAEGTLVATPTGPRPIESLRPADAVIGFDADRPVPTTVTHAWDNGEQDDYAGIAADGSASVTVLPVKGYTRNATLERPFGFVRLYTDSELAGTASTTGLATVDWAVFRGCILTGIQLACAPGSAGWTGSFSALLADEVVVTDATSAANVGGSRSPTGTRSRSPTRTRWSTRSSRC
jgi:hypothetical protein